MRNYCYLFLLYREIKWELICEESCLKRYKRDLNKLKKQNKQNKKIIKRLNVDKTLPFNRGNIIYKVIYINKEIKVIEKMINMTDPQVKKLRYLKNLFFKVLHLYNTYYPFLHKNCENNILKRYEKAAGGCFFLVGFF